MLEYPFFWIGMFGLVAGIMIGISLLEESSSPARNIMFAIGIAVVLFIFVMELADAGSFRLAGFLLDFESLLALSFILGALAGMIIAFPMHGSFPAAFISGGLAALVMFLVRKVLPAGSFGYTGMDDIPTLLDILAAILVGIGTYYLLHRLGREWKQWD